MRGIPLFALGMLGLMAAPGRTVQSDWYSRAVKNVTARFEPAEARPGQTVTFTLRVELHEGYLTYPLRQMDRAAAELVNKLVFPSHGPVIFVGQASDQPKLPSKADPLLGITAMLYCPGGATYTRKAVLSPKAAPGEVKVTTTLKLNVCQDDKCYPERSVPVEARIRVLEGPALDVEPAYAAEVAKALAGP